MKNILVTGATGSLGQEVVARADSNINITTAGREHRLKALNWQYYNLEDTTVALDLNGFECVLHLASNTKNYKSKSDILATQLLIDAMKQAAVPHLIYISIVGVNRIPLPYFKTKYAVEQLIQASGISYSILRSTQFLEFLEIEIIKQLNRPIALFPNLYYQPIDVTIVAQKLLSLCNLIPSNKIIEIGGPELILFKDAIRIYEQHTDLKTIKLAIPSLFLGKLNGALTTPQMLSGGLNWSAYLDEKYSKR